MSKGTIFFDMDGTIADLYGVKDWLKMLRNYDPTPYVEASPMVEPTALSATLRKLQSAGWKLGIVSWLSKDPDPQFGRAVTKAKVSWLNRIFPEITWDVINIIPHGVRKGDYASSENDILFDDEEPNRKAWATNFAFDPKEINRVLTELTNL